MFGNRSQGKFVFRQSRGGDFMDYQNIFKRYELKYLISVRQLGEIEKAMAAHMQPDKYWKSTVRSLYFDTESYRLARHSIEHPQYKEKLRLRSYCAASGNTPVFAELKKKYDSVVYKRRVSMPADEAFAWICSGFSPSKGSQITREIDYFINYYETLSPSALITYNRAAYSSSEGGDLRITFDSNILARTADTKLDSEIYGQAIIPKGITIMEIKTGGGMPLWLTKTLSENHIYKSTFSKYGTVYQTMIRPVTAGEIHREASYA